jgi:hypothetical protein
MLDFVRLAPAQTVKLVCKVESPARIRFPEINSRPEPIVVVFAGDEWFAGNQLLADCPVAAVIAKNKRAGKLVQSGRGAVWLGQFPSLRDKPLLLEEPACFLRSGSVLQPNALHSFEKFAEFLFAHTR